MNSATVSGPDIIIRETRLWPSGVMLCCGEPR